MAHLASGFSSYRHLQYAAPFYLGLSVIVILAGPVPAQDSIYQLRQYTVVTDGGHGVYLGNGFVITASHVVGSEPRVEIAGRKLQAKIIRRGDPSSVDLALLSVDDGLPKRLGLRHIALCQNSPGTGEPVLVATPDGFTQSYVMSPSLLPENIPSNFRTVIRYVELGNSGSGVFESVS